MHTLRAANTFLSLFLASVIGASTMSDGRDPKVAAVPTAASVRPNGFERADRSERWYVSATTVPPATTTTVAEQPTQSVASNGPPSTVVVPSVIQVDWARWQRLHECEQPGNWYANGKNKSNPNGPTFQGGLGMSTDAWMMAIIAAANRGVALPVSALDATPEQQMTGAQAFYDVHGWGWSCKV